ncbi:MAG: carboxypeptidase regulatory-like domain-containing protein, partial [Aldersonia sp.]|nr:carboxypeptidase regulatory-like domain-containing protein [Aldersonia sp.]
MHFGVRQVFRASAQASAERLVQLPPEALAGLSADERAWIRNFAVPENGQSEVNPLPPVTGSVTGKLLAGDGTTVVTGSTTVYLRSNSVFYPRRYSVSPSTGTFTFTSTFAENSSSNISISTGDGFTLETTHAQTSVPLTVNGAFDSGATTVTRDMVFTGTGIVKGTVRRHTSAIAPSSTVKLTMPAITGTVTVNTGTPGTYLITGIPEGTYNVAASLTVTEFDLAGGFSATSVGGGVVERDIFLTPTGGVTGRVKKADGTFPSNFDVDITNGVDTADVNTDTGGFFTFVNVPVGNWTLVVTENTVQTRVPVTVLQDTVTTQNIDMLPLRSVTAVVQFPGEPPVPAGAVPVTLSQAGYPDKTGTTSGGQFTFTNVPGGTPFTIRAWTNNSPKNVFADSAPQTITAVGPALPVTVTLPALASMRVV